MICLQCDNEGFVERSDAVIEQQFKGETLQVQTPALACTKCGRLALDSPRTDELRRRTADAYRRKHGLLTSDAIRALRQLLDMNQREFAAFIGVGESSIKRWETWLVQEKSSDELIRLKCESQVREELTHRPPAPTWFYAQHHVAIENALCGATIQKEVPQKSSTPSRWDLRTDLAEHEDESQTSVCHSNYLDVCGLSPPRRDEFAFSLSAPYLNRVKTLKKKMRTNPTIRN